MRGRYVRRSMLAAAVAACVAVPVALAIPSEAAEKPAPNSGRNACAGATLENNDSIRLRINKPAAGATVTVDKQGKISVSGVLDKHAKMLDLSVHDVVTAHFDYGKPPKGDSWA